MLDGCQYVVYFVIHCVYIDSTAHTRAKILWRAKARLLGDARARVLRGVRLDLFRVFRELKASAGMPSDHRSGANALKKVSDVPMTILQDEMLYAMRLEGAIDITCATELKKLLLEALASGKDVQMDLERVTDLDVTALQLFWAAGREAERAGTALAVSGKVPEPVSAAAREAGFERFPIPFAEK